MEADNNQLLRILSKGVPLETNQATKAIEPQKKSTSSYVIPGAAFVKIFFSKNKKFVFDVAIFSAGIFVMYKYGKLGAEYIDTKIPSEKQMMDMMQNMQPGMM